MLAAYGEHPVVANAVHEASESLGMDLAAIIADDTAINRTENTQPAMLAVCVGVYRAVCQAGISATVFAGHSLGGIYGLVCAAALDFKKALKLVRKRVWPCKRPFHWETVQWPPLSAWRRRGQRCMRKFARNGAQVWGGKL